MALVLAPQPVGAPTVGLARRLALLSSAAGHVFPVAQAMGVALYEATPNGRAVALPAVGATSMLIPPDPSRVARKAEPVAWMLQGTVVAVVTLTADVVAAQAVRKAVCPAVAAPCAVPLTGTGTPLEIPWIACASVPFVPAAETDPAAPAEPVTGSGLVADTSRPLTTDW